MTGKNRNMIREDAWKLLNEMMTNKNLIRHGLAVEFINAGFV